MRLEVIVGDITTLDVEAIVNAANSELWMGGGVAGAIKRAAGDAVEREAVALGPIDPGESVATSAGALEPPIRYVIHAATMGPDLMTSEALIRQATTSALEAAAKVGAKSVGYPALGTGVGAFPLRRAAEVMVRAVLDSPHARSIDRVVFVVRNNSALMDFEAAISHPR